MGRLISLGINRGLLGGNKFFATLGLIAGLVRVLQKISGTGPKTIYKEKLQEGQVIVISDGKSPR